MNEVNIYHSPEYYYKTVVKRKNKTVFTDIICRVTLGYIILDNTVYISAARCSESDKFSRKTGVKWVRERLENSEYCAVIRFNKLPESRKQLKYVPRYILDSLAKSIANREINVRTTTIARNFLTKL
jgi:hypothetical protein